MNRKRQSILLGYIIVLCTSIDSGVTQDWYKPYSGASTEREDIFEFSQKPQCKYKGNDKYEISFAVKGHCDVTIGIIDHKGVVVRHVGSGVLGANAPAPFQKNSLKQTVYWDGKNDLGAYVKKPGQLRVRVMLGLKPEFDKRLGSSSPKNLPGVLWGLAASPEGMFVCFMGRYGRIYIRKFNHDAQYIKTLVPPPANLPENKLTGNGFIEYEPGKKATHALNIYNSTADQALYLTHRNRAATDCRPAYANGRLYYTDSAIVLGPVTSYLHHIFADGAVDYAGATGKRSMNLGWNCGHSFPRLAASPDGKWMYMTGLASGNSKTPRLPTVIRIPLNDPKPGTAFLGNCPKDSKGRTRPKYGTDNQSFGFPTDVACDGKGRIYVTDQTNNRVQIFSPEGKYLKSIRVDRPYLVCVHKKTGGIYVLHSARVKGRSIGRLTKYTSFQDLTESYHVDGLAAASMALDSWSKKPRLWLGGGNQRTRGDLRVETGYQNVMVYEEQGKRLNTFDDFETSARKEAGANYSGRWSGARHERVVCDGLREQVHYAGRRMGNCFFDLNTGTLLGKARIIGDDIAFDKRGYMHCHFNPTYQQGVARIDPSQAQPYRGGPTLQFKEVPYDYGVAAAKDNWKGILPTKCQGGANGFQHGVGVNMTGDVAVESNIHYAPKFQDEAGRIARAGVRQSTQIGGDDGAAMRYSSFLRKVKERQKRGDRVYSIKRSPGLGLTGGTIWTYHPSGELRTECAVIAGSLINGVQIDEEGKLYFVSNNTRLYDNKPFLYGHAGTYGKKKGKQSPFTGTLLKTRSEGVHFLHATATIPMEELPTRPAEVSNIRFAGTWGDGNRCWVEGAEWFYAGASPIVQNASCVCPTIRHHTDWYKRSFVPEAYRHSIGVVDTNGNLILHIGQYGNFDSASGPKSKVPVGGDQIGLTLNEYVSGTDNYLAFEDWSERLSVLKLNYHAEETIGIKMK